MAQNYYAELYFHFVWQTKGRLRLISSDLEATVWKMILEKSVQYGAHPLEVGGVDDHIHLLLSAPPNLLLSDFIGKVKGSTSHFVNTELNATHRFHWGEGYGVLSLAKRNVNAVRTYIRDQKIHHQRGTMNATMEMCEQVKE